MSKSELERFLDEHRAVTRRFLLGAWAGASIASVWPRTARAVEKNQLDEVIAKLEPYFTSQDDFRDVSRGDPRPHQLPLETKQRVGMTRDSWRLEVISDPEHPVDIRSPMTIEAGNAFNFHDLMEVAKTKSIRIAKVMTCLNIGRPLGMGVWEGVPLREVFWKTQPRKDIRRLFYYGYHNDKPEQMFRSSLPINRVLEDPGELPPILLCYKLNNQWLNSERGGPVRVIVPEAYGFKSIKWLSHIVLTNLFHANDTYANGNNDIESDLKTFAATLSVPKRVSKGQPIPVTGFAQVGPSGLTKVEVFLQREDDTRRYGRYFVEAPWRTASVLPVDWSQAGESRVFGTKSSQRNGNNPLPLTRVHWAILLDGLDPGEYVLRSRAIDGKGIAQPMPRPFRKSGHAAIEEVTISVES